MASSQQNIKISYHARSISLPSISHPFTVNVEEQLCKLRSSGAASSSSLSSIYHNLSGLNNLYNSVRDLLQSSFSQQALSSETLNKCINEVLEGSLRQLDMCSTTMEVVQQTKECVQDLKSSLCRKGDHAVANEVSVFMIAGKKANKVIKKCLRDLNKVEYNQVTASLSDDENAVAIFGVLREVELNTLSTFKSLLTFLISSRTQTKRNSWSLASKLMHTKRVACHVEDADLFVMEKLDATLSTLIGKKPSKGNEVQDVHNQLDETAVTIRGLEDSLENIYKNLIKKRVSLLNILSQ